MYWPSLEPSQRDSSNVGHNICFKENRDNYFQYSHYPFLAGSSNLVIVGFLVQLSAFLHTLEKRMTGLV